MTIRDILHTQVNNVCVHFFFHLNTISESTYNYMLSFYLFRSGYERTEKIVLSMFSSSDYLSFYQISEKSHYMIKTNFFILSQLTVFSPTDLSHMKQQYSKLKMFHYYPLQKKLNKGFFSFSDEHCAPPIGVKYPLYSK